MLRYHTGAIFFNLCDTEGDIVQVFERVFVEACKIGPSYVTRAFDKVACDESSSESVEIGVGPRVPEPCCSNDLNLISGEM